MLNAAANSLTAEFGQGCKAVVSRRVAGQDGRVEPVEIRTDELLLPVPVDGQATVGDHASRLTGLRLGFRTIGLLPGVFERTEEWIAALVPQDLTASGHEVRPEAGRRRDCWIGSIVSEEVAG